MALSVLWPTQCESPQADLLHALSALHFGGKYSDLTITCNNRQWDVHCAIVCSRSAFFDMACSSQMREGSTRIIDLKEDDEAAVDQMIQFFYHLDYLATDTRNSIKMFRHRAAYEERRKRPIKINFALCEDPLLVTASIHQSQAPVVNPTCVGYEGGVYSDLSFRSSSKTKTEPVTALLETDVEIDLESDLREDNVFEDACFLLHARVYAIAEKYDIPALKRLAREKFEMAMACFYNSPEFADAIEEVYCSTVETDRGLRDVVIEAFRAHPGLVTTSDAYEIIQQIPTLSSELSRLGYIT